MVRHLGFEKREIYWNFLAEQVPQHAYYSSAYYQHPDAAKMAEKTWMGAELIFDLDSDHLPHAKTMGPVVLDLDSNERREIVDYITGRDLQDSIIFHEQVTGRKSFGSHSFASGKTLKMPTPDQDGWKGRISRGIIELVDEIKKSDDQEKKLREYGVSKRDAERLVKELSDERVNRIKTGLLDQSKTIRKFFLNSALRRTAVSLSAGETDEPVTCDVKRLIRLPSSLHGKTGLKVVRITVNNLKEFDPLRDAVVLPDDPVRILVHQPISLDMNNQSFNLSKGEQVVPTYLAVFLIGRNEAKLV